MRLPAATSAPRGATFVFDSSAMLAYLRGEEGDLLVESILKDETATIYAHSVNLIEVRYDFGAPSLGTNKQNAQQALALLFAAGVQESNLLDEPFTKDVALLIAERRAMPLDPANPKAKPKLALGDAFGLALARRTSGIFVTADQSEIVPMQSAGYCQALFIR